MRTATPSEWRRRAAEGLSPGDRFRFSRSFSAGELRAFGALTRDYNPVHYDQAFAACFHGVEVDALQLTDELEKWLADPAMLQYLSEEQRAALEHLDIDELRRQLIPWADYVTIDQLTDAGRYYFDKTGREVTLEYILIHNVNDQPEHAEDREADRNEDEQPRHEVPAQRLHDLAPQPSQHANTSRFGLVPRGGGVRPVEGG